MQSPIDWFEDLDEIEQVVVFAFALLLFPITAVVILIWTIIRSHR